MQIQYSYRAIDKEFHEPWQRALGNVIEHALKPLLDKHTKDSARLQIVLDRDKIKRQFLASGYMHLPGKKIVSVTASHDELTPLAQMLAQSLFRQAKKHFDRLHAQDQIKRKARRERLRELKVRIAAKPASAAHEAEVTRMPLLSKLEAVARRELAYLRAVGDLPRDYPTLRDVPAKPIWFAATGTATNGGTLAAVMAGAAPATPPRGVVRTTWLAGKAAPDFRWAYIASIAWLK